MTEHRRMRRLGIAIDAPPPAPGEVLRSHIEDDFGGIRFEIGRMIQYVKEGRLDPLVIDTARYYAMLARDTAEQLGFSVTPDNAKLIDLEGIFLSVQANFVYVDDPTNGEVLQTAPRMILQMKTPHEVLAWMWGPIRDGMATVRGVDPSSLSLPAGKVVGDCDEAATLVLALAAAMDIGPLKFRFGGNDGQLHHVWASAMADGEWRDMDATQRQLGFDQHLPFDHFDEQEVAIT